MPEFDAEKIDFLIKRRDLLKGERGMFEQLWENLSRVMLQRRAGFTESIIEGENLMEELFDGTGMQGARSLANTIGAMIRPEGEVFTTIRTEDDRLEKDEAAAEWLAMATEINDANIRNPRARMRQATGEVDRDLVVFGTGYLFTGLALSREHLHFHSMHLKDGLALFDEEGNTAGMFRTRYPRIWQLAERFGREKLSKRINDKIEEGKTDEKVEMLSIVIKRDEGKFQDPLFAKNMPFTDLWIEIDSKHIVHNGGYQEFPYTIPRWDTTSGENYGRSPGMIALPDTNTSQAMQETILVAGQKNVNPPLAVPNDGSFVELNTYPDGLTYYDTDTAIALGGNPFFPLTNNANIPLSREMQNDTRNQILIAYFKNILNLPINGPQMTATEIIQRKDEFIREVGPVFGSLQSDYNYPMQERAFNVQLRENTFGPIPESLQGQNIKFDFEMPITKIRKQVMAAAARQWALENFEMADMDPKARHLVNVEALSRFSHEAAGLPHEILNSPDEVERRVSAEQQAQAQEREMAMAQSVAEIANKGGKAMKDLGLTEQPQLETGEQ